MFLELVRDCCSRLFLFYHEGRVIQVEEKNNSSAEYIIVKAKSQGVQVIGLTRGQDTRFHHTEKLDKGEVLIAQFTDHTSAIKIRGSATVLTKYGTVETDS